MSGVLYVTPASYLAYLGGNSEQLSPEQEAQLLDASRTWDRLCNVPPGYFAAEDGTAAEPRIFTAQDPYELWTGAFYATDGLVVETDIDGDRTFETVWDAAIDYFVEPERPPYNRICVDKTLGGYSFPTGQRRVRVTAPWGYSAEPPPPVSRAVRIIAKRFSKRGNTPLGVVGQESERMMHLAQNDPDVQSILLDGRYHRPTLMAGMGPA